MNRTFFFSFTVLVFILGVMLGFQLRGANAGNTAVPGDREQKLAMEKKNLVEAGLVNQLPSELPNN